MNSREVIAEAARLAAERGWPEGTPNETFLLTLLTKREDARNGLHAAVRHLWNDLDRIERMLMTPSPLLNTLGELQQRPAVVEAAVGQFAAADTALREYLSAFPATSEG